MDKATETRVNEVMRQTGFVVWRVQMLERAAATYFVMLTRATPGMGRAAGEKLLAAKRTFGQTVKGMADAGLLSPEMYARFKAAVDERNWLVHGSADDISAAVRSERAFESLLARLARVEEGADALQSELNEAGLRFVLAVGVTREAIAAQVAKTIGQWQQADE